MIGLLYESNQTTILSIRDMSTVAPTPIRVMKTRDKIKFAFAGFLGLMTCLAISGLVYADYQRKQTTEAEEQQVRQTLAIYGDQGGLPEKIETHGSAPQIGTGVK